MQKKIQAVLVVVVLFLLCSVSMFAQVSQQPATQSGSGAGAQSNNVNEQDIEMLKEGPTRTAEADHRAKHEPYCRRSNQVLAYL